MSHTRYTYRPLSDPPRTVIANVRCLHCVTRLRNPRSILILAPQLYGDAGGIQAYMRRLLEIFSAYIQGHNYDLDCLSLADAEWMEGRHSHPVVFRTFIGCQGSKWQFVLNALRLAWNCRFSLAVVGHIGLAPVALGLRRLGLIKSYILVIYGIEAWKKAGWLDRKAAQAATCVVAITQFTAREFCKHNGVPPDRLRIIPPTLAEEKIELPGGTRGVSTDLTLLTVGRLSVGDIDKGMDILIKAVKRALDEGVKVHLALVGDGDDLSRLNDLASNLQLDGCVNFLGAVPDGRLQELYRECDVFAMPSKKEGFGIVFLEAMRYGKPCIAGNHGGTPEIIDHGVNGYLVDYGDVDGLAGYLLEFSKNSQLRQTMGMKGYQKVKSNYLFPHMADKWFSLLDSFFT